VFVVVRTFFREYDAFLSRQERVSADLTRLDARYHAIIEHGRAAIEGARILDIGSHNGRWALAALCSGAAHVVGIEARAGLVAAAETHMRHYGISPDRYRFVVGDVHEQLRHLGAGEFDTILCLGFFYHTARHFQLLAEFQRLSPAHMIIDTAINARKDHVVVFTRENTGDPLMAAGPGPWAWTGRLSRSLLEDALVDAGFGVRYFDWAKFIGEIRQPCPGITETRYGAGTRLTIHARRVRALGVAVTDRVHK
jgi:16S rRNA G966 N2-methylase RsmD